MKKVVYVLGAYVISLIGITSVANAHTYWIEPNEFYFYDSNKGGEQKATIPLTFEFTGSDVFFNASVNNAKSGDGNYRFRIVDKDGAQVPIKTSWFGKTRAIFETDINKPGTYAIEESRIGAPMYYTELQNRQYLTKATNELSKEEAEQKKETVGYYEYTKSYSTIYKPDDAWRNPVGQKLEIIPLSHPNQVYLGSKFKVRVLFEGKPLAGANLDIVYQNMRDQDRNDFNKTTTDKDGVAEVSFVYPTRYLISVQRHISLEGDTKADSLIFSSSLMLEVNEIAVKRLE